MYKHIAMVFLGGGTTLTRSDISKDGEDHYHYGLLEDLLPETLPRLRPGPSPQIRFNEDERWHDFAPEGGTGVNAGPLCCHELIMVRG